MLEAAGDHSPGQTHWPLPVIHDGRPRGQSGGTVALAIDTGSRHEHGLPQGLQPGRPPGHGADAGRADLPPRPPRGSHIHITADNGQTQVFDAGDTITEATGTASRTASSSTPMIAGNTIYLRANGGTYAFSNPE